jgi:NADH-quinone oxidoreductase subunit H
VFAWTLLKILVVTVPLILAVAFYTLAERKVIGWMHVRHGPQFVGSIFGIGWIQAFADVFKMLFKELIVPTNASPSCTGSRRCWRWRRPSRPGR